MDATPDLTRHAACCTLYTVSRAIVQVLSFSLRGASAMSSRDILQIDDHETLEEKAYSKIKRAVLSATLPQAQPLVETDLAREMHISRTPIRRALAQLEQEGLVTTAAFHGKQVARIDAEEIREIYEVRQVLECHVLRETAALLTDEELCQLRGAVEAAEQALASGDAELFMQSNRAFHLAFARKCGNRHILRVLTALDERVRWILANDLRAGRTFLAGSSREHRLILEAVSEGAVEAAVGSLRSHLMRSSEALFAHWKGSGTGLDEA